MHGKWQRSKEQMAQLESGDNHVKASHGIFTGWVSQGPIIHLGIETIGHQLWEVVTWGNKVTRIKKGNNEKPRDEGQPEAAHAPVLEGLREGWEGG